MRDAVQGLTLLYVAGAIEKVYRDMCLLYQRQTRRVDFLYRCTLEIRNINEPMWVLDWSVYRSTLRERSMPVASFQAGGVSEYSARVISKTSHMLGDRGVCCGTISWLSDQVTSALNGSLSAVKR